MINEEDSPIIPAPDPDDTGPAVSWECRHERHDACNEKGRIAIIYGVPTPGPHPTHCQCKCHMAKRSPRHDWTDFEDEIELERAIAETPPDWLVSAASRRVPGAARDAAWHFMGSWASTTATARYGRVSCFRCLPDVRAIAASSVRIYCNEHRDTTSGLLARAGRCLVCGTWVWFWVTE